MHVGERLKLFRTMNGASREDLAKWSGYSRTYIANIEAGRREPVPFALRVLLQSLGVANWDEILESFVQEKAEKQIRTLVAC